MEFIKIVISFVLGITLFFLGIREFNKHKKK